MLDIRQRLVSKLVINNSTLAFLDPLNLEQPNFPLHRMGDCFERDNTSGLTQIGHNSDLGCGDSMT